MKLTKLKTILASLVLVAGFTVFAGTHVLADTTDLKGDACTGLNTLASGDTSNANCGTSGESTVSKLVKQIVQILSYVVGVAAIIMIIISGFNFVTAGGDSAKVTTARHTLIYALIGLVIVAIAQFLVHFALNTASNATTCPTNPSLTTADAGCKQ